MFHAPVVAGDGESRSPIRLRALSLGAGVQSTALALMAAHGEIGPMPDCAIFADTGWEPKAVYDHLAWLMSPNVLPFPVHVVSAGNIREQLVAAGAGERWASIPAFTRTVTPAGAEMPILDEDDDGNIVTIGMRHTARETVSIGMSRADCIVWLRRHDYPLPPKSACIGCPFHDDARWRHMRDRDPDAWIDAVEVDRAIRTGVRGIRGEVFLHRSAVPLDEADLSTPADHGQLDLWVNECEGMCGV